MTKIEDAKKESSEMKAAKINENLTDISMINTKARKGQHVRFAVERGRCIPPSKAMMMHFGRLDVLGKPDIDFIRSVLPSATFRPTKSGQFARLNEFDAFKSALAEKLS